MNNDTSSPESENMTATELPPIQAQEELEQGVILMPVTVEDCPEEDDQPTELPNSPSMISNLTSATVHTNGSGSSSGSGSTIRRAPFRRRGSGGRRFSLNARNHSISSTSWQHRSPKQPPQNIPTGISNVLQYLDAESPTQPQYPIIGSTNSPTSWRYDQNNVQISPTMQSSGSSGNGSFQSDVFSEPIYEAVSDRSWSPEHVAAGGPPAPISTKGINPPFTAMSPVQQQRYSVYQGSPNQGIVDPQFSGSPFQHQFPNQPPPMPGPPQMNGLPPSPGRMPLTGYQLVAAKISGDLGGPPVKPLYRRFETLNHRLLLFLQDEISELEEQLVKIDAAETQNRFMQGGMPASRRQESAQGGEQQMLREILGQTGYKLGMYNHLLTSFKKAQRLPSATMREISQYKGFLTTQNPIVEAETRFLDMADDLVSLSREPDVLDIPSEDLVTPMPRPRHDEMGFPPRSAMADFDDNRPTPVPPLPKQTQSLDAASLRQLVFAMLMAILVPILLFTVIPGFVGRMAVVLLVAATVVTALIQSGLYAILTETRGGLDYVLCIGLYGGAMAIIAGALA